MNFSTLQKQNKADSRLEQKRWEAILQLQQLFVLLSQPMVQAVPNVLFQTQVS